MSKWIIYGEYGGEFETLKEAKKHAKEASKHTSEEVNVTLAKDGCHYFDYQDGKLTRDGWSK